MKTIGTNVRRNENGAALMTVLLASLLLGTACIALLSAVGASSQNNTDALSEAKAYWAAESGLQASINFLRNTNGMNYNKALANSTLAYHATNYPTGLNYADGKVIMNSEAAYSVAVSNPDASLPYAFYTTSSFNSTTGTGVFIDTDAADGTPNPRICFPTCSATDRTIVSLAPNPNSTGNGGYPLLGTFTVEKTGAGYLIPAGITFKLEFEITSPRQASRTIRGKIAAATAAQPVNITFDSQVAEVIGSTIELCNDNPPTGTPGSGEGTCANVSFSYTALSGATNYSVYASVSNPEPYRLLVTATGYGPNSAQKKLEGVIIKNLFNDMPSTSALTMVGPGAEIVFEPGNGTPTYCGVDPGIDPGEEIPNNPNCTPNPNAPSAPAIGVSDQDALDYVNGHLPSPPPYPLPDIITDGPSWLESATALNNYIYGPGGLKDRSQTGVGSKYIPDTTGVTNLNNNLPIGNFDTGGGLTFCEGSCSVGPQEGGGILVVTGDFEYNGNFNFRGTIIVVGNLHRSGAGNGVILGSVIVAPYNLANPSAGFLSPRYTTNGGGTSDIIYNGAASAFDGTSAVTNLMIGVAEK